MACNNLGLWSYNNTTPINLCFSSLTVNLYGDNLSIGETLYSGASCLVADEISSGYYSNGVSILRYQGGVRYFTPCNCDSDYCVNGTTTYDDTYSSYGFYQDELYYSGSNGYVIYYSSGLTQWCLSTTLGGTCLLFGPNNSYSLCPDLDDSLFYSGVCIPTPSPTPNPCDTFDFQALFDCFITPTPTPTPNPSLTPTPTPTPTATNICGGLDAQIGGLKKTPIPSLTPTITPTTSAEVIRNCVYSGSVIFNAFTETMTCANSKKFTDCFTGIDFYSAQNLYDTSGNTLTEGYVYKIEINGYQYCVIFQGLVENISGVDNIIIISDIGPSESGSCLDCTPGITPTPTPTYTPTPTPTPTITGCVKRQYLITNNYINPQEIQIKDCDGKSITVTVPSGDSYVCSSTYPIYFSTWIQPPVFTGQYCP